VGFFARLNIEVSEASGNGLPLLSVCKWRVLAFAAEKEDVIPSLVRGQVRKLFAKQMKAVEKVESQGTHRALGNVLVTNGYANFIATLLVRLGLRQVEHNGMASGRALIFQLIHTEIR
jgi:hypothetical protein